MTTGTKRTRDWEVQQTHYKEQLADLEQEISLAEIELMALRMKRARLLKKIVPDSDVIEKKTSEVLEIGKSISSSGPSVFQPVPKKKTTKL